MPSTQVSPVKILLDLGIDLDNLSSEEDYLSALKEGAAILQVGGGKTDGRFKILTDEVRKVRSSRKEDAPSAGMKVTKKRISAQKLLNPAKLTPVKGGEGGGDLVVIKEKVVSIEKILGEQYDFQLDQAKDAAQERQDKKRNLREKLLEGSKNIWGGIKKVAGAVISPFQNIWSKILGFIQTIILGRVLFKILEWGANKENQEKIKNIFKFLKNWWPTLLAAYVLFGTSFTSMAVGLLKVIGWGVAKLMGLIPMLKAALAKAKLGKLLKMIPGGGMLKGLGLSALIGGGIGLMQRKGEENLGEVTGDTGFTANTFGSGLPVPVNPSPDKTSPSGGRNPFEGLFQKKNEGGFVSGPAGVDRVPAKLTAGEFVMSKGAVQKYGVNTLASMNAAGGGTNRPTAGRYATGGKVTKGINTYSPELIAEEKKFASYTDRRLVSPATVLEGAVHDVYDDSGKFRGRTQGVPLEGTVAQQASALRARDIQASKKVSPPPPPTSKPKVTIIDQPSTEQVDASEAQVPSKGNRKIPSFDAKCFRSSSKMEVLGISV